MNSRFLIAKYAPDLRRMEPKNIGVIVWSGGQTDSLFIGEDEESHAFVGAPRRIGFKDVKNYQGWITSWRRQLSKPSVELRDGKIVSKRSADFIEGFREWSRENYVLVDGGEAEPAKSASELRALTVQLFRDLVFSESDIVKPEHEYVQLKSRATSLWQSLGVWERPDFLRDQPATFRMFGEKKTFTFDYAVGPSNAPYSVCHRVVLGHQRTFDSVFMNLEHYRQSRNLTKDRCAAMVLPTEVADKKLRDTNLRILDHVATVIDLAEIVDATQEATILVSKNGQT